MASNCPICRHGPSSVFFELPAMPVSIGVQWPTAAEARKCGTGDLRLAFCRQCGFIWNLAFDPARLEYSKRYDNSLDFSPVFQSYAANLARRLIATYGIRHRDVVELGCGKGHFLNLVCELGENRGIGFDPSYEGERTTGSAAARIRYIQDFYGEKYTSHAGDLICCRHVFEHIGDPVAFLANVRRTIGGRAETVVYFEVPNVRFILEKLSVWDIIYEHCNYFGRESLAAIFRQEGFDILRVADAYDGQFLGLEARLGKTAAGSATADDMGELAELVRQFAEQMTRRRTDWGTRLQAFRREGTRVALWGGGSKAVSFLNVLKVDDVIPYVVDINPHKQGLHLPGTAQRIVAPDHLREYRPDVVVLMNPIYRAEIETALRDLGLNSRVVDA